MNLMDLINKSIENRTITLSEFSDAMRSKDESRISEAVEIMQEMGGYDNLPDE